MSKLTEFLHLIAEKLPAASEGIRADLHALVEEVAEELETLLNNAPVPVENTGQDKEPATPDADPAAAGAGGA